MLTLGNGVQPCASLFVAAEIILIVVIIAFAIEGQVLSGAWYSPVRVGQCFFPQNNDSIKVCKGRLEDCCGRKL